MTTKQIDYVLELSRVLNFNHAAANLYITQPTLSYNVKEMEEEIGFKIFERSGKNVVLTSAGREFCNSLMNIKMSILRAIEQGRSFSEQYDDDIRIGLSNNATIKVLSKVILEFEKKHPNTMITPVFDRENIIDSFLKGEVDVTVLLKEEAYNIPNIEIFPLYTAGLAVVTRSDDPLAEKEMVTEEDIRDKTLILRENGPYSVKEMQEKIARNGSIKVIRGSGKGLESALVNVMAGKGIVIAPEHLKDDASDYTWRPFKSEYTFELILCTHKGDNRETLMDMVRILQEAFKSYKYI